MNTSIPSPTCPKCGTALDADAPEGLCPRCLASASLLGETVLMGEEAVPHAPVSIDEIAPHFPQLEILECLGRGGMGIVYKARQKTLNRFVALKLLAPERVHDAAFAERFAREAQALAALSHPGIVTIYDFGEAGRFFFLLMEFIDGVNLRQAMKAGRFTPEQALAIVPPVCEALQYAHEHGIVHRDIKPENLLLDKEGRVKIADFGIAKMLNVDGSDLGLAETQPAGTPQYMAPEQKGHRRTDHRADIYSLGVVLYELLTGELPADKLQPPSHKVQIDVRLDEIVLRALERTPELRYQSAGDFRTQVETMAGTAAAFSPAEPYTTTRFSRTAIVGACWLGWGVLAALWLAILVGEHVTSWRDMSTPEKLGYVITEGGLIGGFLSIPGSTILGWIAVWQIRRSAGRLRGLWLATVDGLLPPLLLLDAALIRAGNDLARLFVDFHAIPSQIHNPRIHSTFTTWLANLLFQRPGLAPVVLTIAIIAIDAAIVHRVWRAVNKPAAGARPTALARPVGGAPLAYVAISLAVLSGVLGSIAWLQMPAPSPKVILSIPVCAVLSLLLGFSTGKSWVGKYALYLGGLNLAIWLLVAVISPYLQHPPRGSRAGTVSNEVGVTHEGPPFVARTSFGTVELFAVAAHPSSGSPAWQADGSPATEPIAERNGRSSADGKTMREIAVRIRNTGERPDAKVRLPRDSGYIAMGSVDDGEVDDGKTLIHVQAIACPPEAAAMNLEIGVTGGTWQPVHSLRKPDWQSPLASEQSSDQDGLWEATVQFTKISSDVALAYHYSSKEEFEMRLVYVQRDGTVTELTGRKVSGGDMVSSLLTLSAEAYGQIKEFQLQRRRYQWVTFRNVSLEAGHTTRVEIVDAPGFGPAIERVLDANETMTDAFLDLDTGQILSAPAELVQSLRANGQLYGGAPQLSTIRAWMKASGADLIAGPGNAGAIPSLRQADGIGAAIVSDQPTQPGNPTFDSVTPEFVERCLAPAERSDLPAEQRNYAYAVHGLYCFQTREGRRGVLEMLPPRPGWPGSVRLRYKQLP